MKHIKLLLVGVVILFSACTAQQKILYLQNVESGSEVTVPDNYIIRIKPLDQLTIVVNSQQPELAAPFNSATSYTSLTGNTAQHTSNNSLQVLTVDKDGYVEIPVIGKIMCAGMTREQLAKSIEKSIVDNGYLTENCIYKESN